MLRVFPDNAPPQSSRLSLGLVAQTPAPQARATGTQHRQYRFGADGPANAIPRLCSAHMGRQSFTADHPHAARRRRG